MGAPKNLESYDPVWIEVYDKLEKGESFTVTLQDAAQARALRFKFYGFRNAIKKRDPQDPMINALFTARVALYGSSVYIGPDPVDAALRKALAPTSITPVSPAPEVVQAERETHQDETDALLLKMFKPPVA